jgi:hypothetical protein
MNQPHWPNHYNNVVYVPIEELAECVYSLDQSCGDVNGSTFIMTKEKMLELWKQAGDKLDAYILPQSSGFHSIGVRYGSEGYEYISPLGDKTKVQALLEKYSGK